MSGSNRRGVIARGVHLPDGWFALPARSRPQDVTASPASWFVLSTQSGSSGHRPWRAPTPRPSLQSCLSGGGPRPCPSPVQVLRDLREAGFAQLLGVIPNLLSSNVSHYASRGFCGRAKSIL